MKKIFLMTVRAFTFSTAMFLICGLAYPLVMTCLSQLIFPSQANGSLIYIDGKAVGSELIGQTFDNPKYMHGRPSAINYNVFRQEEKNNGTYEGVSTGSDNYAPSNPKLSERVKDDLQKFIAANPRTQMNEIPADLMTASGSGLDPHISLQSALIQIPRIAEYTQINEKKLGEIIAENTSRKTFGLLGMSLVNVLKVNLDIEKELKK